MFEGMMIYVIHLEIYHNTDKSVEGYVKLDLGKSIQIHNFIEELSSDQLWQLAW